ncbi:glycosyltransferase family 4 protein [Marinobacter sp.]|uniref:glycosyltransferase family 4 protein n=1 Tax=Marinobacter sp. TaxID=50741 RepID=UPI00384BA05E
MKLFILVHSLSSGGAERVTSSLANYWAKQGWSITIVTIAALEKDFYSLDSGVRRVALGLDQPSTSVWHALRHNFQRVRHLRSLIRREQPDVVLGMMSTASILVSLAAQKTGVPAIGSERIHPPALPLGRVWERLRRFAYPHLQAVVAQTEQSAQWLRDHAGARNVRVIPNPVTYPLESHEPRLAPPRAQRSLLAVGRLAPQKGYERLLAAFSELAPDFPEWQLYIVGEGADRQALEKNILDLGLTGRIRLPGAVGNVADWYRAADLFVMTSRFEGFPNTLAEALSYGLPAVSVDCDTGPRDIIRHGVDGLLVPQNDQGALVDALASLMADEDLRKEYGQRATEAAQRFAPQRIADMWENLFRQVAADGPK